MPYDYHMIVIGGGSAGLVTAAGAAGLGAKVALIEGHKMGGDCLNTGCVPSKTFLRSAHLASHVKNSGDFGLEVGPVRVDLARVMDRVQRVIKTIEPHDSVDRFEKLGVRVFQGYAAFIDAHTVQVNGMTLTAKNVVVATGSKPYIPDLPGLNQVAFQTTDTIFNITNQPKRLIIIGSGSIGLELGQGFAQLGTEVTVISRSHNLFEKEDPEVGDFMLRAFEKNGMHLELGAKIQKIYQDHNEVVVDFDYEGSHQKVRGDMILLATGRQPDTSKLKLEKAGVLVDTKGQIQTDAYLRTNIKNIFVCGDVAGPYKFTHMAGYQAGLVIQNAIFPFKKKVNYRGVPWVTYTQPEVAHVGYREQDLQSEKIYYKKYIQALEDNDRGLAEGDKGFLKLMTNKKGVVVGATMVGEKAGEQIGLANMVINKKMKLSAFLSMTFPYPTEIEVYKTLAMMALRESFKPWQKKLIQKLFLR